MPKIRVTRRRKLTPELRREIEEFADQLDSDWGADSTGYYYRSVLAALDRAEAALTRELAEARDEVERLRKFLAQHGLLTTYDTRAEHVRRDGGKA